MSRTTQVRAAAGLAATAGAVVGLVGLVTPAATSAPRSHPAVTSTPHLSITVSKHAFTVKGPTSFRAGRVSLTVTAKAEAEVEVARFHADYSFSDFNADLAAFGKSEGKNGPTKAGIRHLDHVIAHVTLYGGLDADKGGTAHGTVVLPDAGRYVIYQDSDTGSLSHPHTLTVTGPAAHRASPRAAATVLAEKGDAFGGAAVLPAKGVISFKNESNSGSPHFLSLVHVKDGTTRKQVADFFAAGANGKPAFALPGDTSTDPIGPGHSMTLTTHLPKGQYVELCFFPDPETGIPHAFMGMFRIVTLK